MATDLGHTPDYVLAKLRVAHCLVLEANYDEEMLEKGTYPWSLKRRILGERGHLSNKGAARGLAETVSPLTRHVVLTHLSEHNNQPELALKEVCTYLHRAGYSPTREITVRVAERHEPSSRIVLE